MSYSNSVHNKLVTFFQEGDMQLFLAQLLLSSASDPIKIKWTKLDGVQRYYDCYWDDAAYVGNQASQTKQQRNMYNLQVLDKGGDWRTIRIDEVSAWRFRGKYYNMR